MDEETLRNRAEAWLGRAAETHDPRERASNLMIAAHYAALADLMAAKACRAAPGSEDPAQPPASPDAEG